MTKDILSEINDLMQSGFDFWNVGKISDSLNSYRKAVSILPEDAPINIVVWAKKELANTLREMGHIQEALDILPEVEQLCVKHDLDPTGVIRTWAIALSTARDHEAALALYQRIAPTEKTPPLERLQWHHAVGVLHWQNARIEDAKASFAAAKQDIPDDMAQASMYLPVLGNYAELCLRTGDMATAQRQIGRMIEIRNHVDVVPLAGDTSIANTRALLAQYQKDFAKEAEIRRDFLTLLEKQDPDNWVNKLQMAGYYAVAAQKVDGGALAISHLKRLCDQAPLDMKWVGVFHLSPLQQIAKDPPGAKESAAILLATLGGSSDAAAEHELLSTLPGMLEVNGNPDAAAFIAKLVLKLFIHAIESLSAAEQRAVCETGDTYNEKASTLLRSRGRYQEAAIVDRLYERIRHYVFIQKRPASELLLLDPIPFDAAEEQAEAEWLIWRAELAELRAAGHLERAVERAGEIIEDLLIFKTRSGLQHRLELLPPPPKDVMRLCFVPAEDHCEIHYLWADRAEVVRLDVEAQRFFQRVGDLRLAATDTDAWVDIAKRLYSDIIKPVEDKLVTIDCLEVDARGVLGRIPIGLLSDGRSCVIERVPVRYVLNAARPAHSPARRQGVAHFAAFDTGPLSHAPRAGPDTPVPFNARTGTAFTRQTLLDGLARRPAFLTIATHLETEPTHPEASALLLGDQSHLLLSDLADASFDLNGVRIALFATCSSGIGDSTDQRETSLVSLALEKGAGCVVGTLWDISETAAARFVQDFMDALSADPNRNAAQILATIQARHATEYWHSPRRQTTSGGIGSAPHLHTPEDWAAFAIFENCNPLQPTEQTTLDNLDS